MPVNNNIDFILDMEVNRLPSGITKSVTKTFSGVIGRVHTNALRESQIIPSQVAVYFPKNNELISSIIDNAYSPANNGIDIKKEFHSTGIFYDKQQDIKLFTGTTHTRKDIERAVSKKNSRGKTIKQAQREHYFNDPYRYKAHTFERPELYIEHTTPEGRKLLSSAFSSRYYRKTAERVNNELIKEMGSFTNIVSKTVKYSDWEASSVNNMLEYILDTVKHKGAINIGAWNAQFEAERMTGWALNYGTRQQKLGWLKGTRSGAVKFTNLETPYLNVLFGLAKEDSEIINSMRIPTNPVAFHEFGDRVGFKPRSYDEFIFSAPSKQDNVVSMLSGWHKNINRTSNIEAHGAAIDTYRASEIYDFFNEVQSEALKLAREGSGNSSMTIDEFMKTIEAGNTNGKHIMHDAFEQVVKRKAQSGDVLLNNMTPKGILKNFKENVTSISKKRSNIIDQALKFVKSGGGGKVPPGGGGKNISDFFKKMPKKDKHGYGILLGLAGVAVASTYLSKDNESQLSLGSKLGNVISGKSWQDTYNITESDASGGPYLHHNLDSFFYNVFGAFSGISLIGYRASKLNGKLFGVDRDVPKTAKGLLKNSGKLFRYGIREIEDHFPVTRVFKASSAIDFLTGAFSRSNGVNKGFNVSFKDLDEIKNINRFDTSTFFEGINLSNPEQASALNDVMQMIKENGNIRKAKLNIRNIGNNQTSVGIDIWDTNGNVSSALGNDKFIFDIDTVPIRTSRANMRGRNTNIKLRRLDDAYGRIRSTLANDYITRQRFQNGELNKYSFDEFLSGYSKPSNVNDTVWKLFKKAQFHLELGPKGINQAENIFMRDSLIRGASEGVIGVRGVYGEAKNTLDALRFKAGYYSTFANEFVQAGNRFLESPFEIMVNPNTIKKIITKLKNSKNSITRFGGHALEFIEHPHLGLNLNTMKGGSAEYLLKFGLKRVLPAAGLYYGIKTADSILGGMMFTKTGRGPITSAPNKLYQMASLTYAKVSDILGLTSISKKQEGYAPGTTGLGFFAIPATMAGGFALAQGIYNKSPKHLQDFMHKDPRVAKSNLIKDVFERFSSSGLYKEVYKKEAYKGAIKKSFTARAMESLIDRPKATLFGAGIALMTPFLLGFLGSSKSYNERKAEFAGQKDIAIRKNRGWLMSNQALGGENIQQFRQHGSYIYQSNYENRGVIWPSYTSKLLHAMTLGLANRYMLEEYHKEDQPVYESAPYGANVPIVGPIISKSLGWLLKPIRTMHQEVTTGFNGSSTEYSPRYMNIARHGLEDRRDPTSPYYSVLDNGLPKGLHFADLASHSNIKQHTSSFFMQINELVGFKGFVGRALYQSLSGQDQPDSYTPYLKSAQEMYNPAQFMWQYQAGDFSFPGGEFMRRGLQNPRKKWDIDNIPNELYGQSWLPKQYQTGTTFDKMPMGWLYASRKGWEFQYEGIKGLNPEDYPDNIKLDILKYMAPQSKEFSLMSKQVNKLALSNSLTPFEEQRAYDAVEQRALLKDRLGASSRKSTYSLDEKSINGTITSLDLESMTFTLDNQGDRKYRLAGISVDENDIRNKLLKKKQYSNSKELADDAETRRREIIDLIEAQMSVGSKISMNVANTDAGNFSGMGNPEAIVGSLNKKLIAAGSPLINTGNLSQYNLSQNEEPIGSGLLSKYWEGLSRHSNMFGSKLLGSSNYIDKYAKEQVYNRKVKLWNKPIEHFLQPLISNAMHNFGIDILPGAVKHERATEQYWDIIKYIKYKKLQWQAQDSEEADYYRELSERTMIGADPTNNPNGAKEAISNSKKDYFDYFANEPDSKVRGKIMKLVSKGEGRIYKAIWTANLAKSGDKYAQEKYSLMQQTGGYDVDKSVLKDYEAEGQGSLKGYVRARYINQFVKDHKLPGLNWEGWDKDVDIDNVEVHALLSEGEQVQDYGYFEQQKRQAAYDRGAYLAAQHLTSTRLTSSDYTGVVLPMLTNRSPLTSATSLPTDSPFPILNNNIQSDAYTKDVYKNHNMPGYAQSTLSKYFI